MSVAGKLKLSKLLGSVKKVKAEEFSSGYFPKAGISIEFLVRHFKGSALADKSMYELEAYVLEVTKTHRCSFNELVKSHGKLGKAVSETADHFVSFAYGTKFSEFISALEEYGKTEKGSEKETVWVSLFSINQQFNQERLYPEDWFKDTFARAIPQLKSVLFIASPWNKIAAIERIWCIFELYTTFSAREAEANAVEFAICLSDRDRKAYMQSLWYNESNVDEMLGNIRCQDATAQRKEDVEQIKGYIASLEGGFDKINESVGNELRRWFANEARRELDLAVAAMGMKESSKEYKKWFGDRFSKSLKVRDYVFVLAVGCAKVFESLQDFAKAEEALQLAVELSDGTPESDMSVNHNLAQFFVRRMQRQRAEDIYREQIAQAEKRNGGRLADPDIWLLYQLASILKERDNWGTVKYGSDEKEKEAEEMFRTFISRSNEGVAKIEDVDERLSWQERHGWALRWLGQILKKANDQSEEAKALLEESREILSSEALKDKVPEWYLEEVLEEKYRAEKNLEKLKELRWKKIEQAKHKYGSLSKQLAEAYSALGALLREFDEYDEAIVAHRAELRILEEILPEKEPQRILAQVYVANCMLYVEPSEETDKHAEEVLAYAQEVLRPWSYVGAVAFGLLKLTADKLAEQRKAEGKSSED